MDYNFKKGQLSSQNHEIVNNSTMGDGYAIFSLCMTPTGKRQLLVENFLLEEVP